MNNTTTLTFPMRAVTIMDDKRILSQLPSEIQAQLGEVTDTGFHLGEGRRDYFCTNGCVKYKLGTDRIEVMLD